ncbi:hypothetical protein CKQ79_30095, partial [Klebsiella pneumoniae]
THLGDAAIVKHHTAQQLDVEWRMPNTRLLASRTGTHLGDAAIVKHHTAQQLDVEWRMPNTRLLASRT